MAFNWLERNYLDRVANASALSYNDISSDRIDTQTVGCDAITFLWSLGDVESGSVITAQVFEHTSDAAAGTQVDADEVAVTASGTDTDNKLLAITVRKDALTKRYLWSKLVVATAQAAVDGCVAIAHDLRHLPTTQSADVKDSATIST